MKTKFFTINYNKIQKFIESNYSLEYQDQMYMKNFFGIH